MDVIPLSLGVETGGGVFEKMIERNSNKPCKASKLFTTAKDNQKEVKIQIYEGERSLTKDNHHLGTFTLKVPPAPARTPQIEVLFSVNTDGILTASATNKAENMT